MEMFLYFYERLPCGLDEIEDLLTEGLSGSGEFTGAGSGALGSNIDIEITDNALSETGALQLLRSALSDLAIPDSTVIAVGGLGIPWKESP